MKQKIGMAILLIGLSAVALNLSSCRKAEQEDDQQFGIDQSTADALFSDQDNAVDEAANSIGLFKTNGTCPTVTFDTTSNPKVMTLDFGATNCTGNDGKARRGKIIVTWTGKYRQAGTVITHSFDNFYQNDNKIEGTKTVTNMGLNSSNNPSFSVVIANAKITRTDGSSISWSSTRTREWIAGSSTPGIQDDKYSITGGGSGVNKNGDSFTSTITTPLIIDFSCKYHLVSGVMEIVPNGKVKRTIDYGNGSCDDDAVLTVGKKTYNIKIKR